MFFFRKLRKFKLEKAEAEAVYARAQLLPSRNVPIIVYREGCRWVAEFRCTANQLDNVIAYGDSPAQAIMNFDHLWLGSADFLIDQEEEDEQF